MATRFWLNSSAAPYTPANRRGAWDLSTSSTVGLLGRSTAGTAATVSGSTTVTTAAWDVMLGRWISTPALRAGTVTGTVAWVLGLVESNVNLNAYVHVHIYVTAGDTATVRGTLLADHVGTTEFGAAAAGVASNGSPAVTPVAVQAGDRIVVELGYRASATTTGYSVTLNYGGKGVTDLAAGATTVANPGWIEFSDMNGLFSAPLGGVVDKFTSGISAQWIYYSGTYLDTVSNRVCLPPNADYPGLMAELSTGYELGASAVHAEIPAVPAGGTDTQFSMIVMGKADDGTMLDIRYVAATGTLRFESRIDYDDAAAVTLPYDAAAHRWWRLRESAGTVYWETSPNAVTWTVRRSMATPQWAKFGNLRLNFEAYAASGSPTVAQVDNVSAAPGAAVRVWSGSAWVQKPVKVWNGSAWVAKPLKWWSGSAWS
ncbi:hypothetical protein AB0M10_15480 [Streptomyces sp. NPDC051840]|uniref:hypothetical protein n=1 Tax=Streptomyces sp. NPDC051840 TaxID=3154752 RepID=UPI00341E09BF